MKTGLESLDVGAPEITYSGNQGPKSPQEDQQKMAEFQMQEYMEEFESVFPEMKNQRGTPEYDRDLKEYFQGLASKQSGGIGDMAMKSGLIDEYRNYKMGQEEAGEQFMSPRDYYRSQEQDRMGAAGGGVMQLVKENEDGSRPGYRGSDYGDQAAGRGAYSGGSPGNTGDGSTDRSRVSATQQANHVAAQKAARQEVAADYRNKQIKALEKTYGTGKNAGIFGGFNPLSMIAGLIGGPFAGLAMRGLAGIKGGFKGFNEKMRGINPLTGEVNTQAEYEQARFDRQQTNRLDNLYSAKDKGYNSLFGMKTTDFTPGQQSKIDMLEQNYDPTTARNVDSGRGSGLRNTLAANNMTSELFDPKEIQSLIDNKAALTSNATPYTMGSVPFSPALGNTQPQGLSMMEDYYNSIYNKATGPNIVPDASTLAQQAKTFNTTDALNTLGNTTEKGFFGTSLTDKGKGLESFRNSAVNFYNSPNNTNKTAQSALNFMSDRPGLYGDVIENKDFIQNAINQGFLQTEDDYKNQESLEDFI